MAPDYCFVLLICALPLPRESWVVHGDMDASTDKTVDYSGDLVVAFAATEIDAVTIKEGAIQGCLVMNLADGSRKLSLPSYARLQTNQLASATH